MIIVRGADSELKLEFDRFALMWKQQYDFMKLLQEKRGFPQFPVDLSTKSGQQFLKSITHECMEELFEANKELKNGKSHRLTEVETDRSAYIEELSDAMHFLFEIIILSGISQEEFFDMYMRKGETNFNRINNGY